MVKNSTIWNNRKAKTEEESNQTVCMIKRTGFFNWSLICVYEKESTDHCLEEKREKLDYGSLPLRSPRKHILNSRTMKNRAIQNRNPQRRDCLDWIFICLLDTKSGRNRTDLDREIDLD